MNKQYRIYIANIPKDVIIEEVKLVGYDAFTIIPCTGVWKKEVESCHIVEIISDTVETGNLKRLARILKSVSNEGCFLLTESKIEGMLI